MEEYIYIETMRVASVMSGHRTEEHLRMEGSGVLNLKDHCSTMHVHVYFVLKKEMVHACEHL